MGIGIRKEQSIIHITKDSIDVMNLAKTGVKGMLPGVPLFEVANNENELSLMALLHHPLIQ